MIDPQLENKVVLISGANHGIGAATAKAFAAQGSKVFITYYRDQSGYSEEPTTEISPGIRKKSCKGQGRPAPEAMSITALGSSSRGMKS
ncbi:MAG: SDR family NAD(P)-dependent oxidoreductase [Anaerolineales bacterium]